MHNVLGNVITSKPSPSSRRIVNIAGCHISKQSISLVPTSHETRCPEVRWKFWNDKPKMSDTGLYFSKWGRLLDQKPAPGFTYIDYTGFETEVMRIVNSGEHRRRRRQSGQSRSNTLTYGNSQKF